MWSRGGDNVEHSVLQTALKWSLYLSNRSVFLGTYTSRSHSCLVNLGVPPGSFLGPFPFLLHLLQVGPIVPSIKDISVLQIISHCKFSFLPN